MTGRSPRRHTRAAFSPRALRYSRPSEQRYRIFVSQARLIVGPASDGGILEHSGSVDTVASEDRDCTPIKNHPRWGVYIVFKAGTPLVHRFLEMHDAVRDPTGEYAAYFRPFHVIGLELGISAASAVLRGEATGSAVSFTADVAATANVSVDESSFAHQLRRQQEDVLSESLERRE